MTSFLCVPIHLDALHLTQDRQVVGPMADFSRLPYLDRSAQREINPDVANLSEEIVSQPFHNETLNLKAGIHLHWALPDALTRGVHQNGATTFPAVPNRWLVIRGLTDAPNDPHQAAWLIESDYLTVPRLDEVSDRISYYYRDGQDAPFRYLGRTTPLAEWGKQKQKDGQYLHSGAKLTAIGYGEPSFAAFYPNCHSVFGFYDGAYVGAGAPPQGLHYTIIGWYGAPQTDYLCCALAGLSSRQATIDKLTTLFGWTVSPQWPQEIPQRMLCYSRLTFALPLNSPPERPADPTVQVALGNTPSEALAAFLAHELGSGDKERQQIEDQLEYIGFGSRLDPDHIDFGAKFQEARHDDGFVPVDGGQIWAVVPHDPGAARTQMQQEREQTAISLALPPDLRDGLSELNRTQRAYDRAVGHIETIRHQLFADWYKWMLSSYHPADANREDDYPDPDATRFYIEEQVMKPLRREMERTGQMAVAKEKSGGVTGVTASGGDDSTESGGSGKVVTVAGQIAGQVEQLLDGLAQHDNSLVRHAGADDPPTGQGYQVMAAAVADKQMGSVFELDGQTQFALNGLADELRGPYWTLSFSFKPAKTDQTLCTIPNADLPLALLLGADGRVAIRLDDKHLIRARTQLALNQWRHLALVDTGTQLLLYLDGEEELITPPWPVIKPRSVIRFDGLVGTLTNLRLDNRQLSQAEIRRDMQQAPRLQHALRLLPGPRFYQPTEPVVLLAGDTIRQTERHGQDGRLREDNLLECQVWALDADLLSQPAQPGTADGDSLQPLLAQIAAWEQAARGRPSIAFTSWTGQPWNPLFFEWQAELYPSASRTNTTPDQPGYAADLIEENYELADNGADLTVRPSATGIRGQAHVYSHQALVSSHAGRVLRAGLESFLADHGIAQGDVEKLTAAGAEALYAKQKPGQPTPRFADPLYTALRAYAALHDSQGNPRAFLTQTLGGFNRELLMHKQTLQLPIEDPLGFDDWQAFAQEVERLVGQANQSAPVPLSAFNPIRTGGLQMRQLRLVDTFGQVQPLPFDAVIRPHGWSSPDNALAWLPPRIIPPARVDFRLLSADDAQQEMTADDAHTPICGWFLPNNLDGSLMVYSGEGVLLGLIREREGQIGWASAPGTHVDSAEIPNSHLRRLVRFVLQRPDGPNFLADFLTAIDSALEGIEPAGTAQHSSLALLMGRPVAVVRASVALSLKGTPPINQSWTAFRQDMNRYTRESDNLTAVRFPVRLGNYHQLNDGLVGYWLEAGEDHYQDNRFYAPQTPRNDDTRAVDHPDIALHIAGRPVNLWHALDDPPQIATLLLDPRGVVHATTGVLPVKSIQIPPHHYAAALAAIQVTFLTAPVLTPYGQRSLPLPDEPGHSWSWLEDLVVVERQRFVDFYGEGNGRTVWEHLLDLGWLQRIAPPGGDNPTDADSADAVAKVIAKGHRPVGDDGNEHLSRSLAVSLGYGNASQFEEEVEHLLWHEVGHLPTIEKYAFIAAYNAGAVINQKPGPQVTEKPDGGAVWETLNQSTVGWLRPIPLGKPPEQTVKAQIVPKDQRPGRLTDLYEPLTPLVEAVLDNAGLLLSGIDPQGRFHGSQEVREGWLALRPTERKTT